MAEVKIIESHALNLDDARKRIDAFQETLDKYGVKAKWKGHQAALKGVGVSGSIVISSSEVTVIVKLGMLAKAAGIDAERLGGSIRKRLQAALSDG
jgi:putative polyhydroxyalkanoate system protein